MMWMERIYTADPDNPGPVDSDGMVLGAVWRIKLSPKAEASIVELMRLHVEEPGSCDCRTHRHDRGDFGPRGLSGPIR